MNFHVIFGLVLCAVQGLMLAALISHARRAVSASGASSVGEAAWCAAGIGWMVYGLGTGSTVLVLSGALACAGSAGVLVLLGRWFTPRERAAGALAFMVVAAGLAVGWWVGGAGGIGTALAIFGVGQFAPQALVLRRYWGSPMPGVSTRASLLRTLNTASWAIYAGAWALLGLARYDWPLIAWGIAGTLVFSLTAWNSWRTSTPKNTPLSATV